MTRLALDIRDLIFNYPDGTPALRGVSIQIATGEAVGLVGPNGAGKSTLALNLVGFLKAQSGEARIFDLPVGRKNINEIRKRIGLVFQNPDDQLFMPTLFDDVAFGPLSLELSEEEVRSRVTEAIEMMGLCGLEGKFPGHLSGGQKRSASLAAVLTMEPDIIFLDEPTSNLDPEGRRSLIGQLQKLPHTRIITSHDLEFILEVCERVILMDKGRIVADGPSVEILSDFDLMNRHRLEVPYSLRRDHRHRFPLSGTPHEEEHKNGASHGGEATQ